MSAGLGAFDGPPIRARALGSGIDALLECRHELEHCIAAEHRSTRRNGEVLHVFEREIGRLNGELLRYDGLLRTLSRGRA